MRRRRRRIRRRRRRRRRRRSRRRREKEEEEEEKKKKKKKRKKKEEEEEEEGRAGGGRRGGRRRRRKEGRVTQRNVCRQNHLPLLFDPSCNFHKFCNKSHSSKKGTSFLSTIFFSLIDHSRCPQLWPAVIILHVSHKMQHHFLMHLMHAIFAKCG
jgi:hypothetical protein